MAATHTHRQTSHGTTSRPPAPATGIVTQNTKMTRTDASKTPDPVPPPDSIRAGDCKSGLSPCAGQLRAANHAGDGVNLFLPDSVHQIGSLWGIVRDWTPAT